MPRMTVENVRKAVARIKRLSDDDEAAHGAEDELHQSVLRAIAQGYCDDPAACAASALMTLDIDFERWCA